MPNPFKAIGKVIAKPVTALAGKVDHSIQQKIALSVIRHVVTALGGVLVANGYLQMSLEQQFIGGAITVIASLAGVQQKVVNEQEPS